MATTPLEMAKAELGRAWLERLRFPRGTHAHGDAIAWIRALVRRVYQLRMAEALRTLPTVQKYALTFTLPSLGGASVPTCGRCGTRFAYDGSRNLVQACACNQVPVAEFFLGARIRCEVCRATDGLVEWSPGRWTCPRCPQVPRPTVIQFRSIPSLGGASVPTCGACGQPYDRCPKCDP